MEHDRLKATRVDLLPVLHSPPFWRNVASINQDLAAYSSEKLSDIPPDYHPDKLTQDFSTCYFDPQYLGETATVTIAHELPDGGLGVEQTNGELGPFTYTTISTEECVAGVNVTTEQRVVALAIGERAIPLSPETLLQLDIDKLTSNEKPRDTFSYILSQVREIDVLLAKRRYQIASPEEQAMLIQNTLYNINNYLDVIANDNTVSIVTLHPNLSYDDSTISAQYISVAMEDNCPYFAILDLNGASHSISRDNVIDIEITDELVDTNERINVIDFLNNEATRNIIHKIEDTTAYSDEDDFDELMEDLETVVGSDFCENGVFSGQGVVYRQTPLGDIRGEITSFTQLRSDGFDMFEVNGEERLVIVLENIDDKSPDDLLFIIPDSMYLNKCIRQDDPDIIPSKPDHDLVEDLHNTADLATELIESNEFTSAHLGQQQKMLEDVVDEVRSELYHIFDTLYRGNVIYCTAKTYWAIDINAYESGSYSPGEIAELPAAISEPGEEPFEICGDTISLVIPEMAKREEKITSIADFPLSHGQPMLQIKDVSDRGLVYLVPIESVSGIMPFTWSDETKD
mgnify:FL=1